jgi:hypothetical protein
MLDTTTHKTQDEDKQNKIHNTICVRHHHTQDCVWWCLTYIVLCILFCLSSSCVLCMVVSNIYCVVYFVLFVFVLCLVTNKIKYTTQYMLDTTIHKTQDEDKQNKIHNTIYVRHHHTQYTRRRQTKRMVVSNTYCVVYFVLFVFVLCLVYGGV